VTHAVVGLDAGEKKMTQIIDRKVKVLSEDELLELIGSAPAGPAPKIPLTVSSKPGTAVPGGGKMLALPPPEEDLNSLWTDKWKPKHSSDIIGNPGPVEALRKFLTTWYEITKTRFA